MVQEALKTRIARPEQQMTFVTGARTDSSQPASDDWRQTVGMFRGDAIVEEMIEQSLQMREEDRRLADKARRD
jgi:hypothetical protein